MALIIELTQFTVDTITTKMLAKVSMLSQDIPSNPVFLKQRLSHLKYVILLSIEHH